MGQALSIANRWIYDRVADGEALAEAIQNYEERLQELGLTGFDPEDAEQRDKAIGICIEASLTELGDSKRARFSELAVLPEDENVPLNAIEDLWAETAGFNKFKTDDLVRRLNGLSLLQNLDLGTKTLRLHDNMTWYLRSRTGPDGTRAAHATMVKALGKGARGIGSSFQKTQFTLGSYDHGHAAVLPAAGMGRLRAPDIWPNHEPQLAPGQ